MDQTRAVCHFTFILACLLAWPLYAQTVYRCASTYSQTPCPGATLISVDDSRTPDQKAQTDAAAAQAARSADQMERDRLAGERAVSRTTHPQPVRASAAGKPQVKSKPAGKRMVQDPGLFTAYAPPADKKGRKKTAPATIKP